MEHTLLSTIPVGRKRSRRVSSVRSVSSPEDFLGQANQIAPFEPTLGLGTAGGEDQEDICGRVVGVAVHLDVVGKVPRVEMEVIGSVEDAHGHPLFDPQLLHQRCGIGITHVRIMPAGNHG
jgi:hypothetical protein